MQLESQRDNTKTYQDDDFGPVLICSKETNDYEDDLQEVANDWHPHVAEEVKHLPLYGDQLKQKEAT